MTCPFAEKRQLRPRAATLRSRTGTGVPSPIHNRSAASEGRPMGSSAGGGPSRRLVRFVRWYTVTISTRSADGSDHGRLRSVPLPPRSRTTFNKPANGATRSPVNVSTLSHSALDTPAM